MTRNLFVDPISGSAKHPSEDLASALLGASSGLLVKMPGGSEVRVDRKGIERFKKAAEQDAKKD